MKTLNAKIVDLTHTLSPDIPSWDGECGFHVELKCDYADCSGPDVFRVQKINTLAGMGTHMDAPAHCFPGAQSIDALPLERLIADCAVIKVSDVADEDYLVTPDTIQKFEKAHGTIQPDTFVICYTGWDRFWSAPTKYRNNLKFPSLHAETGSLLVERGVAGLGTDTLSPDAHGISFPIHRAILGAGKYLVENVANANELPPVGAKVYVLPMKIMGATEAPIRLIAVIR